MGFYKVVITETLSKTVLVEANSLEEATEKVQDVYDEGEKIVLGENDFYGESELKGFKINENEFKEKKEGGTYCLKD